MKGVMEAREQERREPKDDQYARRPQKLDILVSCRLNRPCLVACTSRCRVVDKTARYNNFIEIREYGSQNSRSAGRSEEDQQEAGGLAFFV